MFDRALKLNPKLPLSLAGLSKAYLREGKSPQAIAALKKAVELQPDSANIRYQLGQALLKAGRREEAQKELDQAQKLQAQAREEQAEKISGKLPAPKGPEEQ